MTTTIPTFDPAAYVAAIEGHSQWTQFGEGLKQNPYDPRLRQAIGAMQFGDPNSLVGEQPDIVQAYVNGNVGDLLKTVQDTTIDNSKRILTDIVDGMSNPGQALDLILGAGLMPFEGDDRYKTTTSTHKSVARAQAIIQGKNIGAAAADIVEEYGLGQGVQDAVQYHANANPESLLNIYGTSVLSVKVGKFAQEFTKKDGELKKTHLTNYAQYAFTNSEDKTKPAQSLAGMAHAVYSA
jgi:hypothetical protein